MADVQYTVVGKMVDGVKTVGYCIKDINTNKEINVKKDVMAFLVGKGAVQDCTAQLYQDQLLYRGNSNLSMESLPIIKVGKGESGSESTKKVLASTPVPTAAARVSAVDGNTPIKPAAQPKPVKKASTNTFKLSAADRETIKEKAIWLMPSGTVPPVDITLEDCGYSLLVSPSSGVTSIEVYDKDMEMIHETSVNYPGRDKLVGKGSMDMYKEPYVNRLVKAIENDIQKKAVAASDKESKPVQISKIQIWTEIGLRRCIKKVIEKANQGEYVQVDCKISVYNDIHVAEVKLQVKDERNVGGEVLLVNEQSKLEPFRLCNNIMVDGVIGGGSSQDTIEKISKGIWRDLGIGLIEEYDDTQRIDIRSEEHLASQFEILQSCEAKGINKACQMNIYHPIKATLTVDYEENNGHVIKCTADGLEHKYKLSIGTDRQKLAKKIYTDIKKNR